MKTAVLFVLSILLWSIEAEANDVKIQNAASPKGRYHAQHLEDGSVLIVGPGGANRATILDGQEQITLRALKCAWSPDESKVAVVVYYGTKGRSLSLFARQTSGKFAELTWPEPELRKYYKPKESVDMDDYYLGGWSKDNELTFIKTLSASAAEGGPVYFPLECRVAAEANRVEISQLKRIGKLRLDEFEKYLKKIGVRQE
jgi:hypothetical protein